jgi:hypothetical protein
MAITHLPSAYSLRTDLPVEPNTRSESGASGLISPLTLLTITLLGVFTLSGLAVYLALSSI